MEARLILMYFLTRNPIFALRKCIWQHKSCKTAFLVYIGCKKRFRRGAKLTLPQVSFLLSSQKCGEGHIGPLREMPPVAPKMENSEKMFCWRFRFFFYFLLTPFVWKNGHFYKMSWKFFPWTSIFGKLAKLSSFISLDTLKTFNSHWKRRADMLPHTYTRIFPKNRSPGPAGPMGQKLFWTKIVIIRSEESSSRASFTSSYSRSINTAKA